MRIYVSVVSSSEAGLKIEKILLEYIIYSESCQLDLISTGRANKRVLHESS